MIKTAFIDPSIHVLNDCPLLSFPFAQLRGSGEATAGIVFLQWGLIYEP